LLGLRVVDPAAFASQRLVWSVSGLVHAVADTLAARFSACVVRGELSAFSRASSGHCYFSLKDADGQSVLIRCAMFRRAASLLDFAAGDGQLVEVRGRIAVYEPRGELQFVVESMQRAGAGALFEQFLRLKARLAAEGLFAPERKRPLPRFPRRIGVVTSLGAAALHDVMSSFMRRAPHAEIVIYPSLVQGSEAPAALVDAIARAVAHASVDVLIVCRGGGSLEDLWAFNDERVVRAIVASAIPIISGVGHETDVTLADFAADVRAPTPTAAAELVILAAHDCRMALDVLERGMRERAARMLDSHAQRLDASALRLARPTRALQRQGHGLEMLQQRLARAVHRGIESRTVTVQRIAARIPPALALLRSRQTMRLDTLAARLAALDPSRVLSRGYAWLADDRGTPVQSVSSLSAGQSLRAVLHDGSAQVVVKHIEGDGAG